MASTDPKRFQTSSILVERNSLDREQNHKLNELRELKEKLQSTALLCESR